PSTAASDHFLGPFSFFNRQHSTLGLNQVIITHTSPHCTLLASSIEPTTSQAISSTRPRFTVALSGRRRVRLRHCSIRAHLSVRPFHSSISRLSFSFSLSLDSILVTVLLTGQACR